jgi:hypothetical protein
MGDHLLLEDMAEVSGGICGHATDEQSKDQVHGLSQHMMVPAPVDAFNDSLGGSAHSLISKLATRKLLVRSPRQGVCRRATRQASVRLQYA